jgi:hypothetical protein
VQTFLPALLVELERRAEEAERLVAGAPAEFAPQVALVQSDLSASKTIVQALQGQLAGGESPQVVMARLRPAAGVIELVESQLGPAIARWDDADRFATRVLRETLTRCGWPGPEPVVSCSSTAGYSTFSHIGVVFLPGGEQERLLRAPDLFHEAGHCLFRTRRKALLGANWDTFALTHINSVASAGLFSPDVFSAMREHWIGDAWPEEFGCDIIGTYISGGSYGLEHVSLTVALGAGPWTGVATHPADDARARAIVQTLRVTGQTQAADRVEELWRDYLAAVPPKPAEYDISTPDHLINELVGRVTQGCSALGMRQFDPAEGDPLYLPSLLNRAWEEVVANSAGYHAWETDRVSALRAAVGM